MLDPTPTSAAIDDASTNPVSWCVTARLPVTYDAATTALGTAVAVTTLEDATEGHLTVERVLHARPGAVQGFMGRLRCGSLPWQQVPVELAVEPWSHEESMVALRPARPRPPRAIGDRYFVRSLAVLDSVRTALTTGAITAAAHELRSYEPLPKAS